MITRSPSELPRDRRHSEIYDEAPDGYKEALDQVFGDLDII